MDVNDGTNGWFIAAFSVAAAFFIKWAYKPAAYVLGSLFSSYANKAKADIVDEIQDYYDDKLQHVLDKLDESTTAFKDSLKEYNEMTQRRYEMTDKHVNMVQKSYDQHYDLIQEQIIILKEQREDNAETRRIMLMHIEELVSHRGTQEQHTKDIEELKKAIQ